MTENNDKMIDNINQYQPGECLLMTDYFGQFVG